MRTILVPTDFSKNAKNALNYAIAMATKEKAKIILLHSFNITYTSPDIPMAYYEEQLIATENEVKKILEGLCNYVKKKSKVECSAISREGIAVDVILEVTKKKKIDMVIMGTKGASGIKEVLIGSNSAKVVSKSKCPVIVVPEKGVFEGIKKIVFATDYHSDDIIILKKLVEFAKIFKSKIQVLHVTEDEYSDESGAMESFARLVKKKVEYKSMSYHLLPGAEIEKKLHQHLKKESVDMLAISTSDKTLIERIFSKSVARKLVYHTRIPLMVFHRKR